jgi:hypothetical protein
MADKNEPRALTAEEFEREYRKMVCTERHVANSDNAYLEPMKAGPFAIGCVDEVNGDGAREILGFVPTKHELIQMAKYWLHRGLENDFFYVCYAQAGSSESRINSFAGRRLNRIADHFTKEEFTAEIDEAKREFKEKHKISDEDWNTFENGSKADWDQFQEKVRNELNRIDQRRAKENNRR